MIADRHFCQCVLHLWPSTPTVNLHATKAGSNIIGRNWTKNGSQNTSDAKTFSLVNRFCIYIHISVYGGYKTTSHSWAHELIHQQRIKEYLISLLLFGLVDRIFCSSLRVHCLFYSTQSSFFSKPATYDAHNATQSLTFWLEILVCYANHG